MVGERREIARSPVMLAFSLVLCVLVVAVNVEALVVHWSDLMTDWYWPLLLSLNMVAAWGCLWSIHRAQVLLRAAWWIRKMNVRIERRGGGVEQALVQFVGINEEGYWEFGVFTLVWPGDRVVWDVMRGHSYLHVARVEEE